MPGSPGLAAVFGAAPHSTPGATLTPQLSAAPMSPSVADSGGARMHMRATPMPHAPLPPPARPAGSPPTRPPGRVCDVGGAALAAGDGKRQRTEGPAHLHVPSVAVLRVRSNSTESASPSALRSAALGASAAASPPRRPSVLPPRRGDAGGVLVPMEALGGMQPPVGATLAPSPPHSHVDGCGSGGPTATMLPPPSPNAAAASPPCSPQAPQVVAPAPAPEPVSPAAAAVPPPAPVSPAVPALPIPTPPAAATAPGTPHSDTPHTPLADAVLLLGLRSGVSGDDRDGSVNIDHYDDADDASGDSGDYSDDEAEEEDDDRHHRRLATRRGSVATAPPDLRQVWQPRHLPVSPMPPHLRGRSLSYSAVGAVSSPVHVLRTRRPQLSPVAAHATPVATAAAVGGSSVPSATSAPRRRRRSRAESMASGDHRATSAAVMPHTSRRGTGGSTRTGARGAGAGAGTGAGASPRLPAGHQTSMPCSLSDGGVVNPRHDLRIRVAARGVVYIFGRAMGSQVLWWVGSDLVRFALLDRNVISPTFKFKLATQKATLRDCASSPAVRDVVQHALDVEGSLKKRTSTRVRVKLCDTHPTVHAFKQYVLATAQRLNLLPK